jgi:hypothetical protein
MPYRMAFIDSELYDDWFWVELSIDILFFIDVLINCNSAYLDNEGVLVTDRKRILYNYAKGWLVLDIVACFPFSFVDSSGNDQSSSSSGGNSGSYKNFLRLMRLPRLYRLFRITRIIKLLKLNKNSPTFAKVQDFFRLKQSAIRLMTVFVSVAVIAHISACLWYFMAKLEGFGPDTWVYQG